MDGVVECRCWVAEQRQSLYLIALTHLCHRRDNLEILCFILILDAAIWPLSGCRGRLLGLHIFEQICLRSPSTTKYVAIVISL